MKAGLKRCLALLLVLVVQIQPLQVHAIVFDTEQAGHISGQLSHQHAHSHVHASEDAHGHAGSEHGSEETLHASECHPAHVLYTVIVFQPELDPYCAGVHVHPAPALPFIDPSLELPPPKLYS